MTDADPIERMLDGHLRATTNARARRGFGIVAALTVFMVTVFHVVAAPRGAPNIELLAQHFYGMTSRGARLCRRWWSFVAAFVAGWFVAFVYNFVLATWLFSSAPRRTCPGRPTF